jgi:hypothetical protein
VFSLWAESDKYGGLSLSSENVGQVLAVTGTISIATIVISMHKTIFYYYLKCLMGHRNDNCICTSL